jgi:hypothetical protein
MDNSIAGRAAEFLETSYLGPHKDKRVARDLGISPGMAKLLRAGQGWTLARLDQAVLFYGGSFGDQVFGPVRTTDEIQARFDQIDAQMRELLSRRP